jgi:hypothetical protein
MAASKDATADAQTAMTKASSEATTAAKKAAATVN